MRDWTVRQVAVAVVGWRARYHRRAILQTRKNHFKQMFDHSRRRLACRVERRAHDGYNFRKHK